MESSQSQHMQCMEVWGGSQLATRSVELGGLDAWVYSKPYGDATRGGGDVYYASSCATGRINRLLLADVAGHGDAVAGLAGNLRKLMRRYVNYLDQTEFVRSMNRQFTTMSEEGVFATALATTFFAPTRLLSVCNAGHPRPFLYRIATGKWSMLELAAGNDRAARNIPLGIDDITDYEQFDVELEIGDLVLCYTDALIESRDLAGDFLGEQGLLELARSMDASRPEAFTQSLLDLIGALHEGNLLADDVTVLLLRANGKRPKFSVAERLGALGRMMLAVIRSINPRAERAPLPDMEVANVGGAIFPWLAKRWRPVRRGGDRPPVKS